MNCLNCGKRKANPSLPFPICDVCQNTGEKLIKELQGGVDLEYADGAKETIKSINDSSGDSNGL